MQIEAITGTELDDPRLADFASLTDAVLRRRIEPAGGLYIAESAKVLTRALGAGHRPRSVLVSPDRVDEAVAVLEAAGASAPVLVADFEVLEAITGYDVHRGFLAAMHRPELAHPSALLQDARRIVVLENIVDHTNVGAVFRSAAALGADAVLITPKCADPLYRRSVRVSMGTVFQVPWTRIDWPDGAALIRDAGFTIAALALTDDSVPLDALETDPPERLAIMLGAEGDGLSHAAITAADLTVRIPMGGGVDSLNVAAAAAVAIYATRVRR